MAVEHTIIGKCTKLNLHFQISHKGVSIYSPECEQTYITSFTESIDELKALLKIIEKESANKGIMPAEEGG